MAWEGGNADTSWMFTDIGGGGGSGGGFGIGSLGSLFGSLLGNLFGGGNQGQQQQTPPVIQTQSPQPTVWGLTPEDWRNIQYMTGALGQAALQGTDTEWLGNMGGVSAQMAKNAQASAMNKQFQDVISGINNPNVSTTAYTRKSPDGTTETWKAGGETMSPLQQALLQSNAAKTPLDPISSAIKSTLGPTLNQGPSFFDPARKPWWFNPGQQE